MSLKRPRLSKEFAAVLFSEESRRMCIEDCREEIDRIDGELLRLLNRRALLALEIGEMKARAGMPVKDEGRERGAARGRLRRENLSANHTRVASR